MGLLDFFKPPSIATLKSRGDVNRLIKLLFAKGGKNAMEAGQALAEMGGVKGVDAILRACSNEVPNVRLVGAFMLASIKDPAALPRLLDIAKNPAVAASVRSMVCISIGGIGNREAAPAVIALLQDAEASVRSAAASTLGDLGGPQAAEALLKAYYDPAAQFPAMISLSRLKDKRVVPLIREQFPKRKETGERIELTKALVDVGGNDAAAVLAEHPADVKKFCGCKFGEKSGTTMLAEMLDSISDASLKQTLTSISQ